MWYWKLKEMRIAKLCSKSGQTLVLFFLNKHYVTFTTFNYTVLVLFGRNHAWFTYNLSNLWLGDQNVPTVKVACVARVGQNFDDYPCFQPKTTAASKIWKNIICESSLTMIFFPQIFSEKHINILGGHAWRHSRCSSALWFWIV